MYLEETNKANLTKEKLNWSNRIQGVSWRDEWIWEWKWNGGWGWDMGWIEMERVWALGKLSF